MLKTTFLMALLTVLLVAAGGALGGQGGMVTAFLLAVVMNGVSYWFSDKIVLRMYGAKEIGQAEAPQLHRIVQDLTSRAHTILASIEIAPAIVAAMVLQGGGMMMGKTKEMQGKMGEMKKGMGGMMKEKGMMKSEDIQGMGKMMGQCSEMMGDMGKMMGSGKMTPEEMANMSKMMGDMSGMMKQMSERMKSATVKTK